MRIFTAFLLFCLFWSLPCYGEEERVRVAKVELFELKDLLEDATLVTAEDKEFVKRFRAKKAKSEEHQKKMQEAILKGEKINPMEAASIYMDKGQDRKRFEQLSDKLLLEILEQTFGDRYDLILKSNVQGSLLFSKVAIEDVTAVVKQELLKLMPK